MKPDLYEKHYEFEWNHRAYLSSAQNVPLGVMSIVGGALIIIIQKFPYAKSWETFIFSAIVSLSILCLIIAIFFLFRATIGYRYERIATPLKLEKHYQELLDWWKTYGKGGEEEAAADHEKFVCQKLAEATEVNAENNKTKSQFLYKTNIFLAISFVFLAFSSVPYLVETVNREPNVYNVKLIQQTKKLMEVKKMSDSERENTQQDPQTDQTPPKPTGPSNEVIREDQNKPVIRQK